MVTDKGTLGDTQNELMETEKYLGELHGECDWLFEHEVEGLVMLFEHEVEVMLFEHELVA